MVLLVVLLVMLLVLVLLMVLIVMVMVFCDLQFGVVPVVFFVGLLGLGSVVVQLAWLVVVLAARPALMWARSRHRSE